jgi:LCP family protein required for cell wall assembly
MLILGVDERKEDTGRSDTLMLATLNPTTKQGAVLSFPRDMWVPIPGHGHDKICHAYNRGGVQLSQETVEQLLTVRVDRYARLDFAGFKDIVDRLGGVDIDVEKRMQYDDRRGNLHIHLSPGLQHLSGEQAMGYVRYRNDSDYQRIKRQQHFMHALMEQKLTARNIPRLLRLVPRLATVVDTDLSVTELSALVNLLREMGPAAVRGATVPVEDDGDESFYRSRLLARQCNALLADLADHLDSEPPAPCRAEVRNGSGVEGVAGDAADRLSDKHFTVTLTENWESFGHRATEVRYKRGALHTAEWVTKILGCGEPVAETDVLEYYERNAPLRVILGEDYEPLVPTVAESEGDAAEDAGDGAP